MRTMQKWRYRVASTIAWLDSSREDQQRMREIVRLFSQAESRDELGIGQVRDAFSDSLFPGTSTLHTRARYMLFIPWCFLAGQSTRSSPGQAATRADRNERVLIESLKQVGATRGLIGRDAGVKVKNLPSGLYAGALRRYSIQVKADPLVLKYENTVNDPNEERTERSIGAWAPTLPQMPAGFPKDPGDGFDLSAREARWLQERMLGGSRGSLLHHLVADGNRPIGDVGTPWDEPSSQTAPDDALAVLEHARLFSLAVQGPALLYNLMIAERYERAGLTTVGMPVERYHAEIRDWETTCAADAVAFKAWDRGAFWSHVLSVNPRVGLPTRAFLETWFACLTRGEAVQTADNESLRRLTTDRERRQKGSQSRLVNERLLKAWSGASGIGALTYRWTQVNQILQDLHDGLERVDAAA